MDDFEPVPLRAGAKTSVFLSVTVHEMGAEGPMIGAAYAALEGLQGREIPKVYLNMPAGLHAAAVALGRVRAVNLTFSIDPVQHHDTTVGVGSTYSIVMLIVDITVLDPADAT